jgi:hypothetical protein
LAAPSSRLSDQRRDEAGDATVRGMTRLPAPPLPMTLGNMCANGVRSLSVSCWLCHHGTVLAVDRWTAAVPGAELRATHGVHGLRHRWCGCPAELEGPTDADRYAEAMRGKSYDRPC